MPGIPWPGIPCITRKSQEAVPLMGTLSTALAASGQACWKEKSSVTRTSEIRCMVRRKRENRRWIAHTTGEARKKTRAGESRVLWERNKDDGRSGYYPGCH